MLGHVKTEATSVVDGAFGYQNASHPVSRLRMAAAHISRPGRARSPVRICRSCSSAFVRLAGPDGVCRPCARRSVVASARRGTAKRAALLGHNATEKSRLVRLLLRERDGDLCGACGDVMDFEFGQATPSTATVDHVTPVRDGGLSVASNVRLVHKSCNSSWRGRQ